MVSEEFTDDAGGLLAGLSAGSRIAGYRLEEQVGAGGMAVVFRARDERLGRVVALKVLAPALAADAAFRQRFIRESRAGAAVDDPHVIPVFEAGEAGGVLFIAMRYVPGGDVSSLLHRDGPLSAARAAAIVSPVASALDAAHAVGLVHRDVKPANMLVDARPDRPDHVYLSDFGLSKGTLSSAGITGSGQHLGTPDYMAPEQIEGRAVDGRADQYALACAAFELLAGEAPFQRDQGLAVIWAHLSTPPPSLASLRPDLPAAADQVFARALAKAPADRYASCRDFADALRYALELAPYHSGPGAIPAAERLAADHPVTEIASPASPGTVDVGLPAAAVAAGAAIRGPGAGSGPTASTTSGPAVPPGTANMPAAQAVTPGPRSWPAEDSPAQGPRRGGRPIRRRFPVIASSAGVAVVGLLGAIIAFIGSSHQAGPSSEGSGSSSSSHHSARTVGRAGQWQVTGSLASGHDNSYLAQLRDGRVLAISGGSSSGVYTSAAELYDPNTGQWTPAGTLNYARAGFGRPSVLPNGEVLVAGGQDVSVNDYASAELYKPATNQWSLTGSLNAARRYDVQVELKDGRVLVATGASGPPTCARFLTSAEIYDPANGRWTYTGSTQVPRESATGILLADGRVLLAGGYTCGDTDPVATEIYDPATGQWSRAGDLPHGVMGGTMVLLPDHRVLLVDGWQHSTGTAFTGAFIFDPATSQWSTAASPKLPRAGAAATLLPDGKVLVSQGGQLQSEIYDPTTNTWSLGATALNTNNAGQTFLLPTGDVLMAGGDNSTGPATTAELYKTPR
jgi:serine/threonine-protein kinase